MKTKTMTTAQAIVAFLKSQHVERDGKEHKFFAGVWGIFGHGNVAGIGQALQENLDFPYYLCRNEQAAVHIAAGFAKMSNRLRTFGCTSSIGPGATNMVTGAAAATINRIPVLLLPGDTFARRNVGPVLQQLEFEHTQNISVNDTFKAVSRYWDRIERPDQLPSALMEGMRVLTSPADAGAVTLALPQDVQAEAWEFPVNLLEKRVWHIPRPRPDVELIEKAVAWLKNAKKPLIISGGGVLYSEAEQAVDRLVKMSGIPVCETQAGKGVLPFDHPMNLGSLGVTGTLAANLVAREADVAIAIGTRLTDFTTASKTAFQNTAVRFINVNVSEFDAYKHAAIPLVGDARAVLEELAERLKGYAVPSEHTDRISRLRSEWDKEVERLVHLKSTSNRLNQSEVIGIINEAAQERDVVVSASGSLPGDLHKLWRTRNSKGYHLEYGYSCMGYEIAGGLGVKMADPSREVFVLVGDGSYLMMSSDLVTSIQEACKLTVILLDNQGFSSIGGLSQSIGLGGFGTRYRHRRPNTGQLDGEPITVDFAANAKSLGVKAFNGRNADELRRALQEARSSSSTTVIVVEVDGEERVPSYESWWDVPVPEISTMTPVARTRKQYKEAQSKERFFF